MASLVTPEAVMVKSQQLYRCFGLYSPRTIEELWYHKFVILSNNLIDWWVHFCQRSHHESRIWGYSHSTSDLQARIRGFRLHASKHWYVQALNKNIHQEVTRHGAHTFVQVHEVDAAKLWYVCIAYWTALWWEVLVPVFVLHIRTIWSYSTWNHAQVVSINNHIITD